MTCLILAGGLGTRLSSVLHGVPKPMALVGGHPFLEYLIGQLRDSGFRDIVLCLSHKADMIESYFGDGRTHGVEIRYSRERERLGTAGALALARPLIHSASFLALNGDSFCPVDFDTLLATHQERKAVATIVVTPVDDTTRYGSVALDDHDVVTGFSEKTGSVNSLYVNAGIYILTQKVLDLVPVGKPSSIEYDVFPALAEQKFLLAFRQSVPLLDIGTPTSLAAAQEILPKLQERSHNLR